MAKMLFCKKCEEFTMKQEHCGSKTVTPAPARLDKDDLYGKYRRLYKKAATTE